MGEKRGYRKPSPVGGMSGFGWLQGVGLLNKLPYGNPTSAMAAGGAVTGFEVSARAKKVLNFPYCPATLLMSTQEGAEIILFVAS
jgi:hypothetical protein